MTVRGRVAVWGAALAIGAGLLGAGAVRGADPPPPSGGVWQAWREAVTRQFAHARVTFEGARRPFLAGGRDGCPAGPFRRPGLWANVRSPDRKLFAEIGIQIFELDGESDGYAFLKESLHRSPKSRDGSSADVVATESCAAVGNTTVSFIQSGRFWLIVLGSCADGALYRYEVGEVLKMVREKDGAGAPVTFAFSGCGENTPKFVAVDGFLDELEKKATYWGRSFPAARDQARSKRQRQAPLP